jgi:hypothetical protein
LTGATLAGAGAANASGGADYQCSSVGIGAVQVVNCGDVNVLNGVQVVIKDNHVLNGNQINILENALNNVTVNVDPTIYFHDIIVTMQDIYLNVFSIVIAENQVLCSHL